MESGTLTPSWLGTSTIVATSCDESMPSGCGCNEDACTMPSASMRLTVGNRVHPPPPTMRPATPSWAGSTVVTASRPCSLISVEVSCPCGNREEEHTSELQQLLLHSYAVI